MHRGTTIEDAGYIGKTSWPIVPDIKDAVDYRRYTRYVGLAALPAMVLAFFILAGSGLSTVLSLIGPAAVGVVAALLILEMRKRQRNLILNCKMVKVVADLSGTETAHAGKVIFDAVCRTGVTEQVLPLNETFGVYVNAGYKMDDGRTELPYIIFIIKSDESVEVAREAA